MDPRIVPTASAPLCPIRSARGDYEIDLYLDSVVILTEIRTLNSRFT
jgi:hypothetical protein